MIRRITDKVQIISHKAGRNLKYDYPYSKGSSPTQSRQPETLGTRSYGLTQSC